MKYLNFTKLDSKYYNTSKNHTKITDKQNVIILLIIIKHTYGG